MGHDHSGHAHKSAVDNELDQLIEEAGTLGCSAIGRGDEVNQAIESVIDTLREADYIEEDCQDAVFTALAGLIEEGKIPDTPDTIAPVDEKRKWVQTWTEHVHPRLKRMGLEY